MRLSNEHDILVIQSIGNLRPDAVTAICILASWDFLVAGRKSLSRLSQRARLVVCKPRSEPTSINRRIRWVMVRMTTMADGGVSRTTQATHLRSADPALVFGTSSSRKSSNLVEMACERLASTPPDVKSGGHITEACPELVRSTLFPPGPAIDRDRVGTSFAAPKVTRIAARLQQLLPDESALLYRALIVQSARWPAWADQLLGELRELDPRRDQDRRKELFEQATQVLRRIGYGIPDESRATSNTDYRTTFITEGEQEIKPGGCHVYQVPIRAGFRGPAD